MRGNFHVRFLEGWRPVMASGYSAFRCFGTSSAGLSAHFGPAKTSCWRIWHCVSNCWLSMPNDLDGDWALSTGVLGCSPKALVWVEETAPARHPRNGGALASHRLPLVLVLAVADSTRRRKKT